MFVLRFYEGLLLLAFKRISLLLLFVAMMTALAVATAEAQQVPDDSYNPPIDNPAYPADNGPVVAIDEAHYNFHTMERSPARYGPFATLLKRDGYRVRPFTSRFSAQSLRDVDILVIANPQAQSTAAQEPDYRLPTPSAFTKAEIKAVRTWVRNGGSLFLIADHMPWPGAAENLAAAFGIRMLNGYAMNEKVTDENFYFRRSNSSEVLADHQITSGRTATERVDKVVSFTGSAFNIDTDRNPQPLLTLGPDVVSIMAERAWTWDESTLRIPVGGWYQGAALHLGEGRVAVFGEAAMFTAQLRGPERIPMGMNAPYAEENYKFLLNVSHWLSPQDTVKSRVKRVVPAENATGIAPGTNVSAFFSGAMRADSINTNTIKLFGTGSNTPLAAVVSYDSEKKKAILNPEANLNRGAKYKAVVRPAAKDEAGNRLDQNPNQSGDQPKTWFFTIRN